MLDLNSIDKEDTILIIKDLFSKMCSSRRQLKPILSEIIRAIDNNVFIDANSDEVKELLEEILEMQDRLSQVDEIHQAISTKNLASIDEAIREIDQKCLINDLKSVLTKFKTLVCNSEDENELDAAKKLKRQAHKLSLKAEKINSEMFAKEGSKFIDVAEKIEDPSKLSAVSFLEIQNNFPENKFLAFTIMNRSLHFELETDNEISATSDSEIEPVIKESPEIAPRNEEIERLNALKTIINERGLPIDDVLINEDDISIESKNVKKKLSVKSLNNKLHEFVDGSESVSFPILRTFCKCRVFSTDSTFEENQEDKSHLMIPVIVEKLFNWSIADKVSWQGLTFYYLNDQGKELLSRVLSIKEVKSASNFPNDSKKKRIAAYIRRFVLFSTIWALRIKRNNNKLDGDANRFWMRSIVRVPNHLPQSFFSFSLMLFDDSWLKNVDSFLQALKDEEAAGKTIKGVFLISNLSEEKLKPWVEFFETFGIKNIFLFLIIKDDCKLIDHEGNEILPSQWSEMVSFGRVDEEEISEQEDYEDVVSDEQDEDFEDDGGNEEPVEAEITNFIDDDINDDYNSEVVEEKTVIDDVDDTDDDNVEEDNDDDVNDIDINEDIVSEQRSYSSIIREDLDNLSQSNQEDKFVEGLLIAATRYFTEGSASRGMLFLHLLNSRQNSKSNDWAAHLGLEVGYILDDPLYNQQIRTIDPFDFWDSYFTIPNVEIDVLYDYLNLAAIIKSFFMPSEPMSFQLKSRWNQLNDDRSNSALKVCPSAKKLINLFKSFTEQTHASFASCLNVDHSNIELELKNALDSIKAVKERTDAVAHMQIKHPRSKGLVKLLYDPDGKVRTLLNVENGEVSVDTIIEFCNKFVDEDLNRMDIQSVLVTEELFSEAKIGDFLDELWSSVKVDARKNEKFTSVERPRQINVLKQSLVALLSYAFAKRHIEYIKTSGKHKAPVTKALEILNDIVEEFSSFEQDVSINSMGPAVFSLFIEKLAAQINGETSYPFYRDCILGSKYLELTKEGLPITKSYGVDAFSFVHRVFAFENALDHLSTKEAVNAAYEAAVRGCDLGIIKLLEANFREHLNRSDEELRRRQDNVAKQLDRQIERIYHEFLDNIELDRNYDRITNQEEIDRYIYIATEAKEHFAETKNAGIYQRFIKACSADIIKAALPHKNALLQRLQALEEKFNTNLESEDNINTKYPVIAEIHRQLNLGNLTVAEDYLNRWSDNNGQFTTPNVIESQNDAFENFLDDYEYIFNACLKNKSESLEKIYSRLRGGGSAKNRSERDAADFVSAWQGLNTDYKAKARAEASLIEFLRHLSFPEATVDQADKIPPNQWNFHVSFPNYRRSKAAYPHPFAVYGTEIASKGLTIIYLASNRTADNIIETLANYAINQDCGIICLVDFALSLAERRRLAQAFKLRPELKDIIVIDRVLAIFLTRFEDSVRGVKMLKATLPFARVQPYTTGSVVAPEMFIGRSKELAKIRDMSGPVFVYGGRQLGKSALLRQVRNIENDPENGNFAFFIELKGLDCNKSLEKIVRELKDSGLIDENSAINNWDDFAIVINQLMKNNDLFKKSPRKLMLLLDESDEFLASVENSDSRAIDVLRELRETFSGSFKFVLAGLHKVIRFEKNSSFGNLDHISILPFTPTDALELLLKPMSYLGFVINDESLMSAIFSRANYYPGLIQYYCKMIVDAAGDNYSQRNFDVTKNPPYKLDDEYLKNMLGKRDFQDEINKKFQITLKLDDDNFYETIALVIAQAYYENTRPVHVSLDKIRETCFIYDIDKIADMSNSVLEGLLGEMVELNLLRKTDGKYEFNRYAFWHMMGTESEVNSRLTNYGHSESNQQ